MPRSSHRRSCDKWDVLYKKLASCWKKERINDLTDYVKDVDNLIKAVTKLLLRILLLIALLYFILTSLRVGTYKSFDLQTLLSFLKMFLIS